MNKKSKNKSSAKGESWVWLTSLGLCTGLLMVIAVLTLIIGKGVAAFWPGDVTMLELAGTSPARLNNSPFVAGEVIEEIESRKMVDGKEVIVPQEKLYVANRDLYNLSFVYIDKKDILQRSQPQDIMMVERLNDSRALWVPVKLVFKDGKEVLFGDDSYQQKFDAEIEKCDSIYAEVARINFSELHDIIKELNSLKVERYGAYEKLKLNDDVAVTFKEYASALDSIADDYSNYYLLTKEEKSKYSAEGELKGLLTSITLHEKELSTNAREDFQIFSEVQQRLVEARITENVLLKKMAEKSKKLNDVSLHYKDVTGRSGVIVLGNLVHTYYPNRLSSMDKLSMFCSNVWRFLSEDPRHNNTEGGVFPAIFGTLMMTVLMCLFVTPFGVIAAIYLHEYAKQGPMVRIVRIAINNLAAVPSIVYGAFGMAFFVYFLGGHIDELFYHDRVASGAGAMFGSGGMLWASLTLALLTVPVVIVATEESLAAVPRGTREGALGCGATKWQMIRTVVLPACAPGIITGMILAMARGAGEVAPLMLVGVADTATQLPIDSSFPFGLQNKFLHLGYNVYQVGFKAVDSEAVKPLVFATTLLLILIIALLNLGGIIIRQRLKKKYSTGAF